MKTILLPIDEIKGYDANSRINDETVKDLVKAISVYGYKVPIVVDQNNVIVAGHSRWKALKELEYTEALCVVMEAEEDLTREFRIMDNKIHEITVWDANALGVELRGLGEVANMFPNISVDGAKMGDTIGVPDTVTAAGVVDAEANLQSAFSDKVEAHQAKMVQVRCHNCHREWKVQEGVIK